MVREFEEVTNGRYRRLRKISGAMFVKAVLFMRCAPVTLATVAATEPIGNTFRRLREGCGVEPRTSPTHACAAS